MAKPRAYDYVVRWLRNANKYSKKLGHSGLTFTDVAKILGIAKSSLSRMMNGDLSPSPDLMYKFERMLGVPMKSWAIKKRKDAPEIESLDENGLD